MSHIIPKLNGRKSPPFVMLMDYSDQGSRKGSQVQCGYRSVDWRELGQLDRVPILLAGFLLPWLVPGPRRRAAALLALLTRHLHTEAWGLGLFSVAAHDAESENASKQGRCGNAFHHPA